MRSLPMYDAMQGALKQAHMLSSAVVAASGASLLYLLHIYNISSKKIELALLNQATIELVCYMLLPSIAFSVVTGAIICLAESRVFSCHYMATKATNAVAAIALGTSLYFGLQKLAAAASDVRGVALAGWQLQAEDVLGGMNLIAAVFMGTVLFVLYNVVRRPCSESGGCELCKRERDQGRCAGERGRLSGDAGK
ncbi:hypothetical protein [Geomonas oryzae]|uniref:hypothetical protein n=1 Tax=Geomonas oryzae TaxID=2364273 RepID=UPI00100A3973|nr:hypothetical protein [Geomonas oryzae]